MNDEKKTDENETPNEGEVCTCDLQRGTENEGRHHPDCDLWDGHEG